MIYDKIDRCVVLGCAGCAMAHPDFVKSVKADNLCLPNYYCTPGFSGLPTALFVLLQVPKCFMLVEPAQTLLHLVPLFTYV